MAYVFNKKKNEKGAELINAAFFLLKYRACVDSRLSGTVRYKHITQVSRFATNTRILFKTNCQLSKITQTIM